MLIGILRPVWLFHDPYNDEKSWPRVAAYLLVDTGLPAITTAFAVLFLALLRYVCTTQLPNFIINAKLRLKAKLQSAKVLAMPWERNHVLSFIWTRLTLLRANFIENIDWQLQQWLTWLHFLQSHADWAGLPWFPNTPFFGVFLPPPFRTERRGGHCHRDQPWPQIHGPHSSGGLHRLVTPTLGRLLLHILSHEQVRIHPALNWCSNIDCLWSNVYN